MTPNIQDFRRFAFSNGIGSSKIDAYSKSTFNPIYGYVNPTILEERQMNVTALDIFSRLLMDRTLFLGSEINSDVAHIISAQLLWLEQQGDGDITIMISSPGGSIYAGLECIDCMNFVKPDIATVCMGMVASMATVISSSGTKGKRSILPNASFLIHQPLGSIGGMTQASDMTIQVNEINALKDKLYKILTANSNLSYEEIEQKCDRDCILTAQETVDFGFADNIIQTNNVNTKPVE